MVLNLKKSIIVKNVMSFTGTVSGIAGFRL